jgi:prophage regulatory protein
MPSNKTLQNAPSRAIRLPRVCELTGVSPATVWRFARIDTTFPKPFKISANVTVWRENEIVNWIARKQRVSIAQ